MRNLFKPTSYRDGAFMAVGATMLWKAISFINALLIAAYFGASGVTDVYFFLLIVMGVALLFLIRLNASVIIPQAMALEVQSPLSARRLLNGFLYFYIGLMGLCIAAGLLFPVPLTGLFSRFSPALLAAQRPVLMWGFFYFGLQIVTTYQIAVLEMYKRFTSALFTPLNALLPLVCLLVWGKSAGIVSMMYGFVLSNVIQAFVFGWVMKTELEWHFTRGDIWHTSLFRKNLISNQVLELFSMISGCLALYLISGSSAGIVSALNYAKQLGDSATEIFILRVTNISKIELTELSADTQHELFNRAYLRTHHFLVFLLAPLMVFSIFCAPEIVTLFFKRGQFSDLDAHQTVLFLRPQLVLIWCWIAATMQNYAVAAQRKLKEFFPYALISIVLCIVLLPPTLRLCGPFSLPYLQIACTWIGFAVNLIFFKRYLPFIPIGFSLREMGRVLALNLIALFPCAVYIWFMAGPNPWVRVLAGGTVYVLALGLVSGYSGDLQRFLRAMRQTA